MPQVLLSSHGRNKMNFISIVGLFVLLGIAWLMSYHRAEIKIRPIIWGICLQLLFALIILRDDKWSFFGMIILGSLLFNRIELFLVNKLFGFT